MYGLFADHMISNRCAAFKKSDQPYILQQLMLLCIKHISSYMFDSIRAIVLLMISFKKIINGHIVSFNLFKSIQN